ncbi:unnamed protein product, partial [Ectocarpus sp. 12 AP-2014]
MVSSFLWYLPLQGHAKSGFGGGLADTSRRGARPLHVRVAMMSSRLPVVPDTDGPRSVALPFLPRPEALDGTMIGDVGFDPLGFAAEDNLDRYREAELKHGRLAMVALAGWPVATLFLGLLTKLIPPATVCTGNGCAIDQTWSGSALSLEAIGNVSFVYWGSAVALAVAAELVAIRRKKSSVGRVGPDEYRAGDLGLDPFNLADDEMRLREIKHGRLAMAAFAFHYAGVLLEKKGVVVGHQLWGSVCVYNLKWGLSSLPPPICYPRPEAALDTTLSWEIMYRVLSGFFKEPY